MKIITLLLISNLSLAFSLTPLSQSIVIGQNKETAIYQVENKNKEPIAVEVSLVERIMDSSGKEKQPEVKDGLFLLYPTQLILKPGQKRGIKVQWLAGDVKSEKAYRIKVEQLPIDFKKEKSSGIKLLLKYLGALYISKPDFKSKISARVSSANKENISLTISNKGSKHQVLKKLRVILKKPGQSIELEADELKGIDGENILAGLTRKFVLKKNDKLESVINVKDWSGVTLKYE